MKFEPHLREHKEEPSLSERENKCYQYGTDARCNLLNPIDLYIHRAQ